VGNDLTFDLTEKETDTKVLVVANRTSSAVFYWIYENLEYKPTCIPESLLGTYPKPRLLHPQQVDYYELTVEAGPCIEREPPTPVYRRTLALNGKWASKLSYSMALLAIDSRFGKLQPPLSTTSEEFSIELFKEFNRTDSREEMAITVQIPLPDKFENMQAISLFFNLDLLKSVKLTK
jgi:hypothetical protein